MGPPPVSVDAPKVLYVRVRVDGYFEDGAVWSPGMISCPGMVEQLGLQVICMQHGECSCYLNGVPLQGVPVEVSNGDFVAIYKSDNRPVGQTGLSYAVTSGPRPEHTSSASSHCSSGPGGVLDASSPVGTMGAE